MLISTIAKMYLKFKNPPSVAGLPATMSSSSSLPCQVASSLYICSGAPLGFYATVIIIINPMQSKSLLLQGDFLTGPPLKMSLDWPPPNLLGLAPPLISLSVGITFTAPDT